VANFHVPDYHAGGTLLNGAKMKPPKSDVAGVGAGSILRRASDGSFSVATDEVAVEEPLEIRVNGSALAVTMRTPGHDPELAAGFLLSEALIRSADDIVGINSNGDVVQVDLGPRFDPAKVRQRFGTISSSCGLCGKIDIDGIRGEFPPIAPNDCKIDIDVLLALPDRLRAAQGNFDRTGGIHAAAIVTAEGELLIAREDVGRHNAVDKAIGRLLLDRRLPLDRHILMVSGRTSLEIVQKALAAGIPVVASVSAPSSLAINFAREVNQTLIGFLRPPTFNVYAHVERLRTDG
jgi:FdhD protein